MADVAKAVSRATGWSYDLARDILGTAGAGFIAWFLAKIACGMLGIEGASEPLAAIAAGITTASVWQRNRRDNQQPKAG